MLHFMFHAQNVGNLSGYTKLLSMLMSFKEVYTLFMFSKNLVLLSSCEILCHESGDAFLPFI